MPNELIARIRQFVRAQMSLGQTPGLGLSVTWGGKPLMEEGFGVSDVAVGTAMTEHHSVVVGSTTKAFTCAALLQLVDQGKLDLDRPIQYYLPTFRVADAVASATMTVRQAVTHTAGLPPSNAADPHFLFEESDHLTAAAYVADLKGVRLLWQPGGPWVYANDGFIIAGRIIEILSGLDYQEYVRRHLLAPLALDDSGFEVADLAGKWLSTPHDYDENGAPYPSFLPRNRASVAAGSQLMLSASDAGRWLRSVLTGLQGSESPLLRTRSFQEWVRPQAVVAPGVSYGLGWLLARQHGTDTISHGGATITMGSQFLLAPAHGVAIAVVANSVSDVSSIVADGVFALLLDQTPPRTFPTVPPDATVSTAAANSLTGTYGALEQQNKVTGPWTIDYEEGHLFVRTYPATEHHRAGNIYLRPQSAGSYVLSGRGRTGGMVSFEIPAADGLVKRGVWEGVAIERAAT